MPKLQLKTKPHSSATAIYDNSVFQTGRINLNGDNNGIGIFIGTSQALSGDLTLGATYINAGLIVNGGAFIGEDLFVESDISTQGDIQIGLTGSDEQILSLGLPNDDKAWRMRKLDETIRWEKFNATSSEWELMVRFSEC